MLIDRNRSFLFGFLLSIFLATILWAQHAPASKKIQRPKILRFSATNSWSEPYAFFDRDKKLTAGILKEVMDAIAGQLTMSPHYLTLPRKVIDIEAEKNKFDARCYVIESWVKDPKLYNWSIGIFDHVNLIAFPSEVKPVRRIEDLMGQKVGTVLGYNYPKLDSLFANSTVLRSDSGSELSNIEKLKQNRVQYAIVESSQLSWYLNSKDQARFDKQRFFEIERYPVKCAVLKSSSVSMQDFNRAIEKLKRDGSFQKILAKYDHH